MYDFGGVCPSDVCRLLFIGVYNMIWFIITLLACLLTWYGFYNLYNLNSTEGAFFGTVFGLLILIVNTSITLRVHTFEETSLVAQHTELTSQYNMCNTGQNINCAAIVREVYEFNRDLIVYKHYNGILDYYYSDEVAMLSSIN